MTIRTATAAELPDLRALEVAAGVLFRDIGMTDIAEHPAPPLEVFERARYDGRLWVAVDDEDRPIGFVLVEIVDGAAHIEQLSVHPDQQGRGLGRVLIDHVGSWATEQGLAGLTLSTFRSVPWNAPYYARLGFVEFPPGELTTGLLAVQAAETAFGLDPEARVFMRRPERDQ
ncbi:GNAT family N-acetyltransferase [Kribbella sp. NPDC058245]|uniref:GNAT family N-acetyltransferase n=1 Tax=Kribbella sp. NPDC058245 TaxID=3346399 RepID=UPI0036E670E2